MIYGQLYFDRLMLFPGILMVLALAGRCVYGRRRIAIILGAYFVCMLISERTALIASLVIIGYAFLSGKDRKYKNKYYLYFIIYCLYLPVYV